MANTTATLGLSLPSEAENYDVNVTNGNMEKIDMAFSELTQGITSGQTALGEKVDAVQRTATENAQSLQALTQALATANANIATLLTQTRGVKNIYTEHVSFGSTAQVKRTVPSGMNAARIIILTSDSTNTHNVKWRLNGNEITFDGYLEQSFSYQLVEFY